MGDVEGRAGRLAARVNRLIEECHPPDRGPYTGKEIAAGVRALGYPMTDAYLSQLRSGTRDNPGLIYLEGLAAFFRSVGFPVSLDDFEDSGESDAAVRVRVGAVMARMSGLSEDGKATVSKMLADMIDHVLDLERGRPDTASRD